MAVLLASMVERQLEETDRVAPSHRFFLLLSQVYRLPPRLRFLNSVIGRV